MMKGTKKQVADGTAHLLTPKEIKEYFPWASDDFIAKNTPDQGPVAGKGQRRTAKTGEDTASEVASGTAKPRTSRGHTESIRLTVGPLPRACSKNARVHWSKAAKAAKTFRCDVSFAYYGMVETPWPHITVDLLLRKRRLPARMDPDNVWSMFKPGLDGLVDAEIVVDDDTKHVTLGTITAEKSDTDETVITVWKRSTTHG